MHEGRLALARRWVDRRDAGLSAAEVAELRRWLAESEENRAAFATADAGRTEIDWALHAGVVDEVLLGLEGRKRRRRRFRGAAVAAVCALAAGGWAWQALSHSPDDGSAAGITRLVVQEATRRVLPDGSTAQIRAGSKLAIDYSGRKRRILLEQGAAHFEVIRDPSREFVVQSGRVEVRALGTAFAVTLDSGNQVEVLVTNGLVAVEKAAASIGQPADAPASRAVRLGANQRIRVDLLTEAPLHEPETMPAVEIEHALAWRLPHFEFAATPLRDVVARMNRYNEIQFLISDPRVGAMELTGYVRADRVEALQQILEAEFPIRAERQGRTIVLHHRL